MIGNLHFVMGKITHWSSLIYRTAMTRGISIGSQTEGNPSCWKEIHDNDTCMYRNMIKTWSAFVRFDDRCGFFIILNYDDLWHSPYRPPVAVLGPCVQDVHPLANKHRGGLCINHHQLLFTSRFTQPFPTIPCFCSFHPHVLMITWLMLHLVSGSARLGC